MGLITIYVRQAGTIQQKRWYLEARFIIDMSRFIVRISGERQAEKEASEVQTQPHVNLDAPLSSQVYKSVNVLLFRLF